MADSFITQCPHCGTSFRVRTEQLAVANGSVRCGACLQVFSARNHVVTTAIPAQMVPKPKTPSQPSTSSGLKPAAEKPTHKPVAPSAPKVAKPEAKPEPPKPIPPPKSEPTISKDDFSFDTDDDDDAEFLFMDGDDDDVVFKDSPDDKLFDEDEQEEGFGELSDTFLNLNSYAGKSKKNDHFENETQSLDKRAFEEDDDDGPDESWAESILEELERENVSLSKPAVFEAPQQAYSPPMSHQQKTQAMLPDLDSYDDDDDSSASSLLKKLNHENELDFNAEERLSRLRPLGWVAIILLTITMGAQLAWLERDTYARMDQWRGFYQQACNIFGCTLPDQIDLDSVRTSVLVREHRDPQLTDLRIVDIVLTNRAAFKQQFPAMTLQYSDVNGRIVADQQFLPSEYLKGEMTGVELMPINTRIYISLPIKTPAQNAINYQLVLSSIDS